MKLLVLLLALTIAGAAPQRPQDARNTGTRVDVAAAPQGAPVQATLDASVRGASEPAPSLHPALPGASLQMGPPSPVGGAPQPSGGIGSALIGGWASYWDTCDDCAAAGPLLQAMLGPDWQGKVVTVTSDVGSVDLRLVTSCACGDRRGKPTFIDVSVPAFNELSEIDAVTAADPGIVLVSIEVGEPLVALPQTDMAP